MELQVNVPGLLRPSVGGSRSVTVSGATLDDALRNLLERYPLLRVHLYDEQGQLRQHILLYYNADNIAWLASRDVPLQSGDQLHILQAVSGG